MNKEGEKKKPQRNEREMDKERIAMTIVAMFFFHILGKIGKLAHVASQGYLILGF
jgi:hypothetical protein